MRPPRVGDGVDVPSDSISRRHDSGAVAANGEEGASVDRGGAIGIDLAKRRFHPHGARADGSVAFRKAPPREKPMAVPASRPPRVVAMEAGASAHCRGREIARLGHEARLVPPLYVKPFVKGHKNDAADAEAIREAATRPTVRFVAVKTEDRQAQGMAFRARDLPARPDDRRAARPLGGVRRRGSPRSGLHGQAGAGPRGCGVGVARTGARLGPAPARPDRRVRRTDRRVGQGHARAVATGPRPKTTLASQGGVHTWPLPARGRWRPRDGLSR